MTGIYLIWKLEKYTNHQRSHAAMILVFSISSYNLSYSKFPQKVGVKLLNNKFFEAKTNSVKSKPLKTLKASITLVFSSHVVFRDL